MEFYITQCIAGFIAFDENLEIVRYKLFKEDEIVSNLNSGSLPGLFLCAGNSISLFDEFSSIKPIDAFTSFNFSKDS